jgi:hypothetical protein
MDLVQLTSPSCEAPAVTLESPRRSGSERCVDEPDTLNSRMTRVHSELFGRAGLSPPSLSGALFLLVVPLSLLASLLGSLDSDLAGHLQFHWIRS